MKTVNLDQRSEQWYAWRKKVTTASQIPIIMGVSPWSTPNKLWREICLGEESDFFATCIERGQRLETPAKLWAEVKLGIKIQEPVCVELGSYGASLDGYIKRENGSISVVEIKCPGAANFEKMKQEVPIWYAMQMYWQMMCCGCSHGYFVVFDGFDGYIHEVRLDESLIESMRVEADKFRKYIDDFEEPPLIDNDWVDMDSEEWAYAAQVYKNAYEAKRQAENEMQAAKAKMEALAGQITRARGCGISFYRSVAKGNVDYKALIQDKGIEAIELEKYRKAPTERVNIRINELKS